MEHLIQILKTITSDDIINALGVVTIFVIAVIVDIITYRYKRSRRL